MIINADLLQAALLGLDLQRTAVDRKIAEIRRMLPEGPKPARRSTLAVRRRRRGRAAKRATGMATTVSLANPKGQAVAVPKKDRTSENPSRANSISRANLKVVAAFKNKAGEYELTRVDGRVHYFFTNWQGKMVDSH
jgi:hypothetical protein